MSKRDARDPRKETRDPRDPRRTDDPIDPRDKRVVPVDARDTRQPGDPRDVRVSGDTWTEVTKVRKVPATVMAVAYLFFGLGLLLQPDRWDLTPAYKLLLDIFDQSVWGVIYLVVAAVLAGSVWLLGGRVAIIVSHMLAIALTTVWFIAFVIRWITDRATTCVNPTNWLVLLAILVFSVLLLGSRPATVPPTLLEQDHAK